MLERNGHADFGGREHVARAFEHGWLAERDLVLAADRGHASTLRSYARTPEDAAKVRLFRSFDPAAGEDAEMPDPWYGGQDGFVTTLATMERAMPGLADAVRTIKQS